MILTAEVVKDKLHVVHKFVRSHLSYHHPCLLHEVSIVVVPTVHVHVCIQESWGRVKYVLSKAMQMKKDYCGSRARP